MNDSLPLQTHFILESHPPFRLISYWTRLELAAEKLLVYDEPWHLGDWSRLLESAGLTMSTSQRGGSFNSYIVYLQAAINGDGIAIGWHHLLEDHLQAGNLRLASELTFSTQRGYFCYLTAGAADKQLAKHFMDWVCSQVE